MAPAILQSRCAVIRRRFLVRGQVQGVGFRPWVYRLATARELAGFVRNNGEGVEVQVQGEAPRVDEFGRTLRGETPPLARIDQIVETGLEASDSHEFHIEVSADADETPSAQVTVDSAVCPDCLREMFDASDRRHQHALITCTNCGPRFSIIRGIPYDRPNTTMASFAMCPQCDSEYRAPTDRRFHAQPIACHECGPKVTLVDPRGVVLPGDPIARAAELLLAGKIVAVKGLGGFHLACRADDDSAVERLRQLKQRDFKPFALMCADLDAARRLVKLSDRGAALLTSARAPIVLAERLAEAPVAPSVAPGNHRLGVMLPNTPLQHLLMRASCLSLVMTSGNMSDEPLVIDNAEAVDRLGSLCDAILWHDRPIERHVDDSVLIDVGQGEPIPVRRARGYVPGSIDLPPMAATRATEPGLALGGELKNTVAVYRDAQTILSQHMGDLSHPKAFAAFKKSIDDLMRLFEVRPRWIAHDLHPIYLSTRYAKELAARMDCRLIGVQHHHAHAAAVMAEHGIAGPVIAIVCDGTGFGEDRTIWGGEILLADLHAYRRLAHLRPIDLIGGDAAARDTRRVGLALLRQAYGDAFADHPAARRIIPGDDEREMLATLLRKGLSCVPSSGCGRYFDGVAALLELCERNHHEAQAGMALEGAAGSDEATERRSDEGERADFRFQISDLRSEAAAQVDLAPLVRELVDRHERGADVGSLSRRFHEELARALADAAIQAARAHARDRVVLSGGCFCNGLLTQRITERLERGGLTVLRHRRVPPNDGGLSLGQAAVAAARNELARNGGASCV